MDKFIKIEHKKWANPVDVFNKKFHPQDICKGSKNYEPAADSKDIIIKGGEVAFEWNDKKGMYYTVQDDNGYQRGELHSPFTLLTRIAHNNKCRSAMLFVRMNYMGKDIPYIRVGDDYFKKIKKKNNWGVEVTELKTRKEKTIKQDHNKRLLNEIPVFDDFTIEPNNKNYQQVVSGFWNMYEPFPHKASTGDVSMDDIPVTTVFMERIFGDQLNSFGWKYMRALYMEPKRILPVLVLASEEKETGKTTFLNWLSIIFGNNYVGINATDLSSSFNSQYATKNIIGVDESIIQDRQAAEKIKHISTAREIMVNTKMISQYKIPFYGKLVLTTNNPKDFVRVDQKETRYVVRRLQALPKRDKIKEFKKKLRDEVPKFLTYIEQNIGATAKRHRNGFAPELLANDSLRELKEESRSWLYKELEEEITNWFNENPANDNLYLDPKTIKERWFENDRDAKIHNIHKTLKDEMGMEHEGMGRYNIMAAANTKPCKAYCFKRHDYVDLSDSRSTGDTKLEAVPF